GDFASEGGVDVVGGQVGNAHGRLPGLVAGGTGLGEWGVAGTGLLSLPCRKAAAIPRREMTFFTGPGFEVTLPETAPQILSFPLTAWPTPPWMNPCRTFAPPNARSGESWAEPPPIRPCNP